MQNKWIWQYLDIWSEAISLKYVKFTIPAWVLLQVNLPCSYISFHRGASICLKTLINGAQSLYALTVSALPSWEWKHSPVLLVNVSACLLCLCHVWVGHKITIIIPSYIVIGASLVSSESAWSPSLRGRNTFICIFKNLLIPMPHVYVMCKE